MCSSLSPGGTRARQRNRPLKDLSERLGTQERYSPGCGFLIGRLQPVGVCGVNSEHVPNIHFLLCRRSSGGVHSCILRLFGKLDPNANFKEKDKDENQSRRFRNNCQQLAMSEVAYEPISMTASIRRRIPAATNLDLVLAIMASSNWRVVRTSVWLCATLAPVRRQILTATGTSVTALSTLFAAASGVL
jgi:hypothetical protein